MSPQKVNSYKAGETLGRYTNPFSELISESPVTHSGDSGEGRDFHTSPGVKDGFIDPVNFIRDIIINMVNGAYVIRK